MDVVDFELNFFTSCQVSLFTRLLGMTPPAPLSEAVTHYGPKKRMVDDSSMVSGEKVSLEELQRQIAESEGSRET